MIQMMMVLGVGGVVMFSSQSQALSLNLSFCNGGINLRLDDDKHKVNHDRRHEKQVVNHGKKKHEDRKLAFRDDKLKVAMQQKNNKHDKRR